MVLNCYRLAKYYQIDPATFLRQTISEITRHIVWTERLNDRISAEQEAMDPS